MDILASFSDNIADLLHEKNITVEEFASTVNIAFSEVYRYLRKTYLPNFKHIIQIADAYGLSLDYLLGLIPFPENATYKKTPPFSERFKEILQEKQVTRYRLNKDTGIPINRLDSYYAGRRNPSVEKAIQMAQYFNCSLDYLFGREQ